METWAANKQKAKRTRAISGKVPFLLTGLIYCAACGKRVGPLSGLRDGTRSRYCYTVISVKKRHEGVQTYFDRNQVEDAVLSAIAMWLKVPPPPLEEPSENSLVAANTARLKRINADREVCAEAPVP
jgi:hypothetical protein